jgi:ribonuclease HI
MLRGIALTKPRAEMAGILLALLNNRNKRLIINSSSLSTLNLICYQANSSEDKSWHKVADADLLRAIIHELRTQPEPCSFHWACTNGNEANPGILEAKKMIKHMQIEAEEMIYTARDHTNSRALHDGAKISSLEMRDTYSILVNLHTSKTPLILHPERLELTKASMENATKLRPTNLKLIEGIWKLPVYPRLRDLLWNALVGRLKIGRYWQNMPGYEERAHCKACTQHNDPLTQENEAHLWTECRNNRQKECWNAAKVIWKRCTHTAWPEINIRIILGIGTFRFPSTQETAKHTTDSERFGTMTSLAVWAIWKARNERTMNPERQTNSESASLIFKETLKDIIKKSWIATNFEPENHRLKHTARLTALWGHHSVARLERGKPPIFDF